MGAENADTRMRIANESWQMWLGKTVALAVAMAVWQEQQLCR